MNDKEKMLNLMRFWLFGTFIIVFTATAVYTGGVVQTGLLIFREANFWIAIGLTAVLCVIWYQVYKWYLNRPG